MGKAKEMSNEQKQFVVLTVISIVLLVFTFLFTHTGCNDDCTEGDQRCNGNALEMCGSDNNWEVYLQCDMWTNINNPVDKVVCCEQDNEADCVSENECDEK